MGEPSVAERAELLAQMAPHPSVSKEVLADQENRFPESRLAGKPPVAYLEGSEAPAYVLTNEKRGVALGTKRNRTTPDDDRGTVVLITGRRTICLVGSRPDDGGVEIPHESVVGVSVHTGLLANRLELRTGERTYHCWVGRGTDASHLDETAAYIEDRLDVTDAEETPNDDEETSGDDAESQVMYRGRPVDPSYLE